MTEPTLNQKIAIIKNVIKNKMFSTYLDFYDEDEPSLVYPFYVSTNENLNYMTDFTSFEGKHVLVPTASGDHALNAIFLGAKSVETFDINSIAKYQYNLKETAIKVLPRDQFLDFYTTVNFFNERSYNQIKPFLKIDTKMFFDNAFSVLKNTKHNVKLILAEGAPLRGDFIRSNPYLESDKAYKTLQSKLGKLAKPVSHKVCGAHELEKHFQNKDVIILSNIPTCYYGYGYDIKPVLKSVSKVLAKNGSASLNYIYGTLNKLDRYFLCKIFKKGLHSHIKPVENPRYPQKDSVIILGKE